LHQLVALRLALAIAIAMGSVPGRGIIFGKTGKTTRILLTGDCIPYPKLHS
jgi:hypothetical protein